MFDRAHVSRSVKVILHKTAQNADRRWQMRTRQSIESINVTINAFVRPSFVCRPATCVVHLTWNDLESDNAKSRHSPESPIIQSAPDVRSRCTLNERETTTKPRHSRVAQFVASDSPRRTSRNKKLPGTRRQLHTCMPRPAVAIRRLSAVCQPITVTRLD